ncbi:YchJ family metal-binding protein [Hydrogenovibrio sp. 3SP14C1]|uniref:YchJ family protein n=1 Tax=Hydrogenovibrio sp. 3SP14C1 TaxID=3038774 RepID=UPI0024159AC6|nr:YchJ family metal-binding protein [Hydrogenovibrio sp. 3SP14C1]MDG4813023.1 YchJ family metal-binding protein [Hydrogenovibrio sp. 3SP14C1]
MTACPCGSKKTYAECCEPFHLGQTFPQSAERLMRTRYSAYVMKLEQYLINTWAESTRPNQIEFEENIHWLRLRIVKTKQGHAEDQKGMVFFKAFYEVDGEKGMMTEKSQFIRDEAGHWAYLSGEVS